MTLTEFLLARIAEDEAACAEAHQFDTTWHAHPEKIGQPIMAGNHRIATCAESVMAHIARHDPARVLAECQAKRRIVERWATWYRENSVAVGDYSDWIEGTRVPVVPPARMVPELEGRGLNFAVLALALPYADHPDYREEWRA